MNGREERLHTREVVHIYRIYFPESDKCYIGQTIDLKRRMKEHLVKEHKSLIHRAFNKYDEWEVTPLHVCYSHDDANRIEIEEIRNFDSIHPNGYNLTRGGEGCDTFTNNPNKEGMRAKQSAARKAYFTNPENRTKLSDSMKALGDMHPSKRADLREAHSERMRGEGNSFYGKKHTDVTKQRISNANKGRVDSEETRVKKSESKIGKKNSFYGKKHNAESLVKMSESTDVTGEKNPFYGKKHSDKSILKMCIAQTKRQLARLEARLPTEI
ncbi:hypothetical protein LCGC14_0425710 [marine sediment metagenome]|uniref:GIY-YIG domain-containing protein n=1 Tax=marine sediment metagenome TaxID=412755 RepID=A0A0F9SVR1_9ZZZZ